MVKHQPWYFSLGGRNLSYGWLQMMTLLIMYGKLKAFPAVEIILFTELRPWAGPA